MFQTLLYSSYFILLSFKTLAECDEWRDVHVRDSIWWQHVLFFSFLVSMSESDVFCHAMWSHVLWSLLQQACADVLVTSDHLHAKSINVLKAKTIIDVCFQGVLPGNTLVTNKIYFQ